MKPPRFLTVLRRSNCSHQISKCSSEFTRFLNISNRIVLYRATSYIGFSWDWQYEIVFIHVYWWQSNLSLSAFLFKICSMMSCSWWVSLTPGILHCKQLLVIKSIYIERLNLRLHFTRLEFLIFAFWWTPLGQRKSINLCSSIKRHHLQFFDDTLQGLNSACFTQIVISS